ncbi:Hypothetical protein NocV09_01001610, partial [Nannochloropsis oceanica]
MRVFSRRILLSATVAMVAASSANAQGPFLRSIFGNNKEPIKQEPASPAEANAPAQPEAVPMDPTGVVIFAATVVDPLALPEAPIAPLAKAPVEPIAPEVLAPAALKAPRVETPTAAVDSVAPVT